MINGLLKYISPLTVSTALLLEPVLGSILGYFFGMQDLPSLWTCVGGLILLIGLVLVVSGENGCESIADVWNGSMRLVSVDVKTEEDGMSDKGDKISSYGAIPMPRERSDTADQVL